jgi:hypothetical protein
MLFKGETLKALSTRPSLDNHGIYIPEFFDCQEKKPNLFRASPSASLGFPWSPLRTFGPAKRTDQSNFPLVIQGRLRYREADSFPGRKDWK